MKEITISKENFKKVNDFVLNEFKEEVLNKIKDKDENSVLEEIAFIIALAFSKRLEQVLFDENQKTND